MGARSSPLLRDLSLLPTLCAGAGRGRTGGGSEPPPAGALQRSDGGDRDPGASSSRARRVNKVPGGMRWRDRAQGQWPCSRTRIRACLGGLGHLPTGEPAQRPITAVGQPLGPHRVKLHRSPERPQSRKLIRQTPSGLFFHPTVSREISKSLLRVANLLDVNL